MKVHLTLTAKRAKEIDEGIKVLKKVLKRLRWNDQGGYPSRVNGRWAFVTGGLPQATPEEHDALFALAGIVPDEIKSKGEFKDCVHSKNGHEQGYSGKCSPCKRPRMSNFRRRR